MRNEILSTVLSRGRSRRRFRAILFFYLVAAWISPAPLPAVEDEKAITTQSASAGALDKISAEVTFDPAQNIIAVNFTDADFSDKQLALLHDLPKLEAVVITGSAFTDHSVPLVSGLKNVKQ